uniref:Uncharacterized protein n=1 Tax=Lygus hesperus TaxID=30085 RepID=A0A0A9W8I0_LYGHE
MRFHLVVTVRLWRAVRLFEHRQRPVRGEGVFGREAQKEEQEEPKRPQGPFSLAALRREIRITRGIAVGHLGSYKIRTILRVQIGLNRCKLNSNANFRFLSDQNQRNPKYLPNI